MENTMDIKEIISRHTGSLFEQDELAYVIQEYFKEKHGKDVKIEPFTTPTNPMLAQVQMTRFMGQFDEASAYYFDKFKNEK